ncbi:PEP-CTERM sorting domain-containing protein [Zooshikella sp. RANM57]|uniref:PEP-CTERM sorting domain-containing protein n=1 Tax=Zooshikella sp. RANM57 TaxID=3425863 RepID=UPI003D6F7EDC
MKKFKALALSAAIGFSAVAGQSAVAGFLDFDLVDDTGIFQNPVVTAPGIPLATIVNDFAYNGGLDTRSTLFWGEPSNLSGLNPGLEQSNLDLVSHKTISIDALGVPYELSVLTHNNNVVSITAATLGTAQILGALSVSSSMGVLGDIFLKTEGGDVPLGLLSGGLVLDPDVPDDIVPPAEYPTTIISLFDIDFTETPNFLPCDPPNPFGSTCDDFFSLMTDGGFPLHFDVYIDDKLHDLFIYSSFDADGSTVETGPLYYTPEVAATDLYTFGILTLIPEPTSIGMMLAGLFGVAGSLTAKRRKKQ